MSREHVDFNLMVDNIDTKFRVYVPTQKDQQEADKIRNTAFNEALESHAMLKSRLSRILKEDEKWSEQQNVRYENLNTQIIEGEKRLKVGGFSLTEAKRLALDIRQWRQERRELLSEISELYNNTAEGQADNARFNYLVSACLVYYNKDGQEAPYFKNLDDYLNRGEMEVAVTAANKLAYLMYSLGKDADKVLPENQFLLDFNFVNENLQLIDEEGRLVDENGNLIELNISIEEEKEEYKGFYNENGEVVLGKSHRQD